MLRLYAKVFVLGKGGFFWIGERCLFRLGFIVKIIIYNDSKFGLTNKIILKFVISKLNANYIIRSSELMISFFINSYELPYEFPFMLSISIILLFSFFHTFIFVELQIHKHVLLASHAYKLLLKITHKPREALCLWLHPINFFSWLVGVKVELTFKYFLHLL